VSNRIFLKILEELEWPRIYLLDPKQYFHVDGMSVKGSYGISSVDYPVISIQKGLRGKVRANVIYHEVGHLLFPSHHHWWIECAAERLARGGGRGYWSGKFGHSVDEMPSRNELLKLFRRASKRFNGNYKNRNRSK
jgi:hypothetical protein